MARDAGLRNISFLDDSFAEMVERTDLPQFDIIVLHGIYSWVSVENRHHIVEFIRRRLKVGGVVYISYNTMPGWAPALPMRRLLVDEAEYSGGAPIIDRIDLALKFAVSLSAAGAGYFRATPSVGERLNRLESQSRQYLAHEYFNKEWTPFYFADVVNDLSSAKLDWLCSSNIIDNIPMLSLSAEHQKVLNDVRSPIRRESVRDYLNNQQFRRDLFVKGPQDLSVHEFEQLLISTTYALVTPRSKIALQIQTAAGTIQLQDAVYNVVLDSLAAGPISGLGMIQAGQTAGLQPSQVIQAINILSALHHLSPLLPVDGLDARRQITSQFNAEIMRRAERSADLPVLASPVSGTGVFLDRVAVLLLSAVRQNIDPVEYTLNVLERSGQRLIVDGKSLTSVEENRQQLSIVYQEFAENGMLNICKMLQVI